MEIKRLLNLTTGILHTEVGHIYEDLEFLTGMPGLMTHQLPNAMRAAEPYLRKIIPTDQHDQFFTDKFTPEASGDVKVEPMGEEDQKAMQERFSAMPSLLAGKDVVVVVV